MGQVRKAREGEKGKKKKKTIASARGHARSHLNRKGRRTGYWSWPRGPWQCRQCDSGPFDWFLGKGKKAQIQTVPGDIPCSLVALCVSPPASLDSKKRETRTAAPERARARALK